MSYLIKNDPEIAAIVSHELLREEHELNLIASENYTSKAILEATGSILTNKYAEGYSGKRYYGGCQVVDQAELLAIERCKTLFNAQHVNVQPHAGSQANMAAYTALVKPGELIMGMSLATGGHLTHGHAVNFSGSVYRAIQYGVDLETGLLNYQAIYELADQHKPKLIIAGASAYSRIIDFEKFAQIAQQVGALLLVDMAHISGLVAAGVHPSPVPYADCVTSTTHKTLRGPRGGFILCKNNFKEAIDKAIMPGTQGGPLMHVIAAKAVCFKEALTPAFITYQQQVIKNCALLAREFINRGYVIVTGGTDNHLFIIDLRNKNITGRAAEVALEKAGISVSRSCIPGDPEKPWITSGIRIGSAAITTRGMREQECIAMVDLIDDVIKHHTDEIYLAKIKQSVLRLCDAFPIYAE
ncbi:MAG: serine hydroxymethyltransferase [Candidatus Babeliaceae bacterium]|jgi:glycine hydroxymethyltransferase